MSVWSLSRVFDKQVATTTHTPLLVAYFSVPALSVRHVATRLSWQLVPPGVCVLLCAA